MPSSRRAPTRALATMLFASGLVFASTTSVTAALPQIGRSLQATQAQVGLMADAYPVILAALVLPGGGLLDRRGRRRGMVLGLLALAASQAACASAGTPGVLMLGRCISGVAAAIVLPGTLATITAVMPAQRRSRAVAAWTGGVMLGASLGMLLGGAAVDVASWQVSFLVIGALALLAAGATVAMVPETSEPGAARADLLGAVLCSLAIGGLVLGTIELPARSISDPLVLGALLAGTLALIALIVWELHTSSPLLDLRLFAQRPFAVGNAALVVLYATVFGWFFLAFQYFAYVRGYGAIHTGIALLPCVIGVIPLSLAATRIAQRLGRGRVIAGALVTVGAGTTLMALAADTRASWWLALAFLVFGLGVGLGSTPPTDAIIEALPPARQGIASAINDAAREIGAALGIAVLASVFNAGYRARTAALLHHTRLAFAGAIKDTPSAVLHLPTTSAATHARIAAIARDGVITGWRDAFIATTIILWLLVPLILRWDRPARATASPIRVERRVTHPTCS
jgi:MFS family permease